jgi:hypothetical protein
VWIHRRCQDPDAPFLASDCADFAPGEAQAVVFGAEPASGNGPPRRPWGRPDGRGALDIARGGTLVLEHLNALDVAFQEVLLARLAPSDETLPAGTHVQLVATVTGNPAELAASERIHPALAQLPVANVIQMPPLRARRDDVVPLANYLLAKVARKAGTPPKPINGSAETALRKLQFRHANVAELKEAIDLAAVLADGPDIGAEHLFTGPKVEERRGEYELEHAGVATTVLFLAIIWSERVFHMPRTPAATGVFLIVLASFPAVMSMIYEREVWCRYLCPLGALSAGYAVPSPVVVHANQTVCASQCTTHDCSKGSACEAGCPVFLHPLYVRDAHFCKLCFSCLRNCRHQSAKLYVHLPLLDIWRRAELSATLIPFATITFFVALVMLASQKDA